MSEAASLIGPYDVIARVQAPNINELGNLVVSRVQAVAGVVRTLTCSIIHLEEPTAVDPHSTVQQIRSRARPRDLRTHRQPMTNPVPQAD